MDDIKKEFWGDLQVDLYTSNSAVYLANQRLESLISTDGRKAHRAILSHPDTGTYTKGVDINFSSGSASKQTLEVDTFKYAAEEIDITDKSQTPYDLVQHSLTSIRKGLMNLVEQKFLSEILNASYSIQKGTAQTVSAANILDIIEEADGELGSADASLETAMKAAVFGPKTIAKLRRAKIDRETKLGDTTLENGVIGPMAGWTFVQNNNLPWSAKLNIATNPTEGDTITIMGVTFTYTGTIGTTAGNVLLEDTAAKARANLKAAIEGGAGKGTKYVELSNKDKFKLRRKRNITCTTAQNMVFAGYGDISVSETLTAAADIWSEQKQSSIFMQRGAIDMVLQFMDLKVGDKEKGFADLPKGIIGCGTKIFDDGDDVLIQVVQDASGF